MILLVRRRGARPKNAPKHATIYAPTGSQWRCERTAVVRHDFQKAATRSAGDLRRCDGRELVQDARWNGETACARGGGADELGCVDDDVGAAAGRRSGVAQDRHDVGRITAGPREGK